LANPEDLNDKNVPSQSQLNTVYDRPSLIARAGDISAQKPKSILDSVSKSPFQETAFEPEKPQLGAKKLLIGAFLALSACAAAYWAFDQNGKNTLPTRADGQIAAAAVKAPTTLQTSATPSAPVLLETETKPVFIPEKSPQERKIEEAIAAPLAPPPPPTQETAAPSKPVAAAKPMVAAATKPALDVAQKRAEQQTKQQAKLRAQKEAAKTATARTQAIKVAAAERTKTAVGSVTPAASATASAASGTANIASASTARASQNNLDRDVDLIAAVMTHNRDTKQTPRPAGFASTPVAVAGPQRSASTIAELVQGCDAKPNGERISCVRVICEGSWGKANACPTALAPRAARMQKVN
jgi:hypothetical protein